MDTFLREQRLYNNGLQKKFSTPDVCSHSLMGIQSQLHYYGMISIFLRTKTTSIKQISKSKNLIKSWGQRATHHIYHQNDYAMINSLLNKGRWPLGHLEENGVDTTYVIETLRSFCESHTSFTKEEILNLFPETLHDTLNIWSALVIVGCTQGLMYVEVLEDNTKLYHSARNLPHIPKDMSYMLKQYFTFYGPATIQDFSHWSGIPQREFIHDFNSLKQSLYCTDGLYYSLKKPRKHTIDYPIILGKFDPLLVSYKDKSWILGEHDSSMIWRKAAHVEGVIIDETGLIGTWHYSAKPNEMTYVIKPITAIDVSFIESSFSDLSRFMNRSKTSFSFEAPYY